MLARGMSPPTLGMSQSAQEDLCGTSASADLAFCSLPVSELRSALLPARKDKASASSQSPFLDVVLKHSRLRVHSPGFYPVT